MNNIGVSLFSKIRFYREMSNKLQSHLAKNQNDWMVFQKAFNENVDKIYQDIMDFEKENLIKDENKVYKLKKIFANRYRRYFLYGDYIKWSYKKPFGYAGDFKIIDMIYLNAPQTSGFDRLWDNYFQQLAAPIAIRARKEEYRKLLLEYALKNTQCDIRIMNLASGPAREIKEVLESQEKSIFLRTKFDCYDFDDNAIAHAKSIVGNADKVSFFKKNAIRLALKSDITKEIDVKYNIIYSTGLFDYLDHRVAVRLVKNLRELLKPGGILAISNGADKYSNPSASWMEWVAEWYLIYRTRDEFAQIFLDAGFSADQVKIVIQPSKVMQNCIATKN